MHELDTMRLRVPEGFSAVDILRPGTVSLSTFQLGHVTDDFLHPPQWFPILQRLVMPKGLDLRPGIHLAQLFSDAGLEDIQVTRYLCPLGLSDGLKLTEAERRFAPMYKPFYGYVIPMMLRKLAKEAGGVDEKEIEREIENGWERVENWDGHQEFVYFYVVCGRKPTK